MNTYYQWTPYTYLIGWPELNMWYYGVRYAKNCHPADFWNPYKTSSKQVKNFIKLHGDPPVKQIRKQFTNTKIARLWENRVLKKLHVVNREDYLNKTDNISIQPLYGNDNPASRPEVKSKISAGVLKWYKTNDNSNLGKTWTEKEKQEWSELRKGSKNPMFGRRHKDHNLQLYSTRQQGSNNSFFGKNHTKDHNKQVSERFLGIPKSKICCLFCHKEVGINVFPRWHGENCKIR
jgi:hypothetical protein